MKLGTLKHVAAGVSQSFVGRNNDVGGYRALGELYKEASAPDYAFLLLLLDGVAIPSTRGASQVAKNDAAFLQRALVNKGIALAELAQASVYIQFNADLPVAALPMQCGGRPFRLHGYLENGAGQVGGGEGVRALPAQPVGQILRSSGIVAATRPPLICSAAGDGTCARYLAGLRGGTWLARCCSNR